LETQRAGSGSRIRVFILTRTRLLQDGLAHALSHHPELEVAGAAADPGAAVRQIRALAPDIALVDVAGPQGIGVVQVIHGASPEVKVVALAMPEVEDLIIGCAEAGVAGYVTREGTLDDLVSTLRSVSRGETLCSPRIAGALLRRLSVLAARPGPEPYDVRLTARELQIVALIEEGLSNKEIASQLCIALATVKNHVHNILEKLQVRRRTEAVARLNGHPPAARVSADPPGSRSSSLATLEI
jgi:two-component system, NarL family, nitrate/nitrite response regulator NarL